MIFRCNWIGNSNNLKVLFFSFASVGICHILSAGECVIFLKKKKNRKKQNSPRTKFFRFFLFTPIFTKKKYVCEWEKQLVYQVYMYMRNQWSISCFHSTKATATAKSLGFMFPFELCAVDNVMSHSIQNIKSNGK